MLADKEKELFLRDKIYSLYVFLIKTVFTISSAALAFSIGIINSVNMVDASYGFILFFGWGLLIIAIIVAISVIEAGIKTYYCFVSNLALSNSEVCKKTEKLETVLAKRTYAAFMLMISGLVLILGYFGLNL